MDSEYENKQKQLTTSTTTNVDDAYINGLSFHSLLTYASPLDHVVQDPYSPVPSSSPYLLSLLPFPQKDEQKPRQRLSDRTRILQKLLPMDKKMDMATVLEESYKYIKFLEAQVRVLESMPSVTSDVGFGVELDIGVMVEDLVRLNRQELLQVVVNSQAAQDVLCSNRCCVYSVEQLVKLKNKDNNSGYDEKQGNKVDVLVMNTDSNF